MNYIEVGHVPMCELTPGAEYRHIGDEQKIVYEQLPACMSQALPRKYRNKMVPPEHFYLM